MSAEIFPGGATSTFFLSFSGFIANESSDNALKVLNPNFQGGKMPVPPLRTPMV